MLSLVWTFICHYDSLHLFRSFEGFSHCFPILTEVFYLTTNSVASIFPLATLLDHLHIYWRIPNLVQKVKIHHHKVLMMEWIQCCWILGFHWQFLPSHWLMIFFCLLPQDFLAFLVAFCGSFVKVFQNRKYFQELSLAKDLATHWWLCFGSPSAFLLILQSY